GRVLRRAVRVRRPCLQHIRARSSGPRRDCARIRAGAACRKASIACRPGDFHDRDADRFPGAACRLRADLRRSDPPPASRRYKSMRMSRSGTAQHMRMLPSRDFLEWAHDPPTPGRICVTMTRGFLTREREMALGWLVWNLGTADPAGSKIPGRFP